MSTRIGARELKGLIRVLKDAGVASFTAGDLSLTFRDPSPQVPMALQEGEQAADGALDLPDGVFDPRAMVTEMYRKRAARQ